MKSRKSRDLEQLAPKAPRTKAALGERLSGWGGACVDGAEPRTSNPELRADAVEPSPPDLQVSALEVVWAESPSEEECDVCGTTEEDLVREAAVSEPLSPRSAAVAQEKLTIDIQNVLYERFDLAHNLSSELLGHQRACSNSGPSMSTAPASM